MSTPERSPWDVELVGSGKWQFTNATDTRAVGITFEGIGSVIEGAVPHPLAPGESFTVKLPADTGLRILWNEEGVGPRTWWYQG